jgi:hypothetical protein
LPGGKHDGANINMLGLFSALFALRRFMGTFISLTGLDPGGKAGYD